MINHRVAANAFIAREYRRSSRQFLVGVLIGVLPGVAALGLSLFAASSVLQPLSLPVAAPQIVRPPVAAFARAAPPPAAIAAPAPRPAVAAIPDDALFDPEFAADSALLWSARHSVAESDSAPASRLLVAAIAAAEAAPPAWERAAAALGEAASSPPPRPAEVAASTGPPSAVGPFALSGKGALPATPLPDGRTMEKLFGAAKTSAPALAYASPESGQPVAAPVGALGPSARYDRWTAVYDLAAHTVYLPNGARLEAHSGLGNRLDDPAHVSERNRGATPPHVYELASLDQLFHGVRALRLNPVGGGDIFGRDGLLAHTYMLGPRGDSNGCVVFRNYGAFLQAFQTGQVKRLAVVARLD